ncbi:biotin transporter BioY [Pararhodobacter aggregans]|uniref:Biotin transporter n=1 Tax=Pararhodobacter aggregans TaxID=404875 RepID=A0A2T7UUT2_9RHOB|nr:biotin transporter BioY [Pararhodobacter aggregans]PTX04213.1 biotin transport system substrate-specific component [Pararhodobacter aggregans]PVE48338.1 biotin transporter BioY [Pararhodobacter aggregans]
MAQQTLLQASLGTSSLVKKALIVLGGSALIAVGAQVSVPMLPVPMTLQTLAILMVGFTAGSRLGAAAVVAYLLEGAAGLPVFAGGGAGAAYLMGPTGGFLLGFVAMAWAAGLLAERGVARGLVGTALAALAVSAALYVPGLAWLTAVTPLDLTGAINAGALPFLPGDVVKAVAAALIVSGAWNALGTRRG